MVWGYPRACGRSPWGLQGQGTEGFGQGEGSSESDGRAEAVHVPHQVLEGEWSIGQRDSDHGRKLLYGDRDRAEMLDFGLGRSQECSPGRRRELFLVQPETARAWTQGVAGWVEAGVFREPLH